MNKISLPQVITVIFEEKFYLLYFRKWNMNPDVSLLQDYA